MEVAIMSKQDFTLQVSTVDLENQKQQTMGITGIKQKDMKKHKPLAGGNGTIIDEITPAEILLTVETEAGVQFDIGIRKAIKDVFGINRLTDKQFDLIKQSMPESISIDCKYFGEHQRFSVSDESLIEWKTAYLSLKK